MAKTLGIAFDRDYYFNPGKRLAVDRRCNEYAAEHFAGMRLFYSESNLGQIYHLEPTYNLKTIRALTDFVKTLTNVQAPSPVLTPRSNKGDKK